MEYDFNNVRQMLEDGVNIEDMCAQFAANVNAAQAEINERKKHEEIRKQHYNTAKDKVVEAWNECVDVYGKAYGWPGDSISGDYYINSDTVENLISVLSKIMEFGSSLASLTEKISNETDKKPLRQKIVANSSTKDFANVIGDFLNDIM